MDVITHEMSLGADGGHFTSTGQELSACCLSTLKELAENNPMMACQHCERIIKLFEDEKAFQNYAKFCRSRNREIQEASFKHYKIIVFRKQ